MNPRKGARLYPQDLDALHGLGRSGFLSADQLRRYFYPNYSARSATNRLALLTKAQFLSRTPCPSRTSPHAVGRTTYVYYWTPANQRTLQTYLEQTGHASEWQTNFAHLTPLNNHEETFAPQYLAHETDIVEYFLCLEIAAAAKGWEVIFWERTSPFSKELRHASGLEYGKLTISQTVRRQQHHQTYTETREEQVTFNPDGLYGLKSPDEWYELNFHEEDNNTSQPRRFRQKLIGYQALDYQGYFVRLRDYYITKYHLPAERVRKGFRVTTATPNAARRDTLFLDSLSLQAKGYRRFLFASMEDITPATAFDNIWIRGKEYDPIRQQLAALPPETAPKIYADTLYRLLADMPRVSLASD
jgi:hypothetical protein